MTTGLAGLLLAIATAIGPNGHLVQAQLAVAEHLPVARTRAAAAGWWIVFHDQRSWAPAFYSPPESDVAVLGAAAALAGNGPPPERLLPLLRVPRLFLYAPYYRQGAGLRPVGEMAVDVAEIYLNVLLEAVLDGTAELSGDGPADFLRFAERRSDELMPEVPAPQRREAYLSAVSDFASHLLSIANEIERAERRARGRGGDLCALLDPPQTLFALWRQSWRETVYRGRYPVPAEAAAERWRSTVRGLDAVDKAAVVGGLLGAAWTGDPARDFHRLCRPADDGS